MVPDAVEGVCLGEAGSAAGPGQLSLVSMASVVVGGIRFAVPASKNFILEYSDCFGILSPRLKKNACSIGMIFPVEHVDLDPAMAP